MLNVSQATNMTADLLALCELATLSMIMVVYLCTYMAFMVAKAQGV
jgi:hypothetical protein